MDDRFGDLHRQQAMESLHSWALDHRDAWPTDALFDRVLRATLADGTKTFGAIALQTANGYGPTALKNARSLFETLVVAYWMTYCAAHDWVVERMREHQDLARRVLADAVKRHHDWWEAVGGPDIEEIEDEDRLVALYGKAAQLSWWAGEVERKDTGRWKSARRRDLRDLVADLMNSPDVEGRLWEAASEGSAATPLLQTMLDIPHRLNNQLVHHTPAGLTSLVDLEENELVFDDSASSIWVAQAQTFGYVSFSLLLQLCIDLYRPELRDDFESALNPGFARAWVTLSDDKQRIAADGAHRNRPCPCGSGLKAKRCHGV